MNRMERIGDMSLKGSDRYYLAALGVYLSRHSVPSLGAIHSLKGSDRYTLRHRRRFSMHIII